MEEKHARHRLSTTSASFLVAEQWRFRLAALHSTLGLGSDIAAFVFRQQTDRPMGQGILLCVFQHRDDGLAFGDTWPCVLMTVGRTSPLARQGEARSGLNTLVRVAQRNVHRAFHHCVTIIDSHVFGLCMRSIVVCTTSVESHSRGGTSSTSSEDIGTTVPQTTDPTHDREKHPRHRLSTTAASFLGAEHLELRPSTFICSLGF